MAWPVKRALHVAPAGSWPAEQAADRITLGFDDRYRRRLRLTADGGTAFLLDLDRTTVLRDGDGLALEDSTWIAVHAAPEAMLDITAATPADLVRLAWHIGNRHILAQFDAGRILIRDDPVIAAMLRGLGATVTAVRAPFTPESGAYAGAERNHHDPHPHPHSHG